MGQGDTTEIAVGKLREAIDSIEQVRKADGDIHSAPLAIEELHEFLTIEGIEPTTEPMEMRALYA